MMENAFELDRGKVFVSGLHWQALSGNPSEAKNEAQQLAKQLEFDLAISRAGGAPQIGFAATVDGYKAGMLSAAAVVSKTLELEENVRDFLCAAELPDRRFLLVVQADGVITPDGDAIGSEDEIRAKILEYLSIDKAWDKTYAPLMWGIQGSVERSFDDFLPKKNGRPDYKHAWWALKPVKANFRTVFRSIAPFVVVGAVLAGGFMGYQKWQRIKAQDAAMAAQALANANQPVIPPHPWKDKPVATAAVVSCAKSFSAIRVMWPGNWKPESVVCAFEGGVTTVTWKRGEKGWVQHLLEVEPRATISDYGESATLSVPLEVGGAADEALVDERGRVLKMLQAGQQYGVNVTFTAAPAPPALPGAQQGNQTPIPWREVSWQMRGGSLSPETIIKDFDGPGFRIRSITARINEGLINWELEGMQYVLP